MSVPVYPDPRERGDIGGVPCGGTAPGGTPTFMALSGQARQKRLAQITKRLPYGPRAKPCDPCCAWTADAYWPESLPWLPSPLCAQLCSADNNDADLLGCRRPKSQFQSRSLCGLRREQRERRNCAPCDTDECAAFQLQPCTCKQSPCQCNGARDSHSDDESSADQNEWLDSDTRFVLEHVKEDGERVYTLRDEPSATRLLETLDDGSLVVEIELSDNAQSIGDDSLLKQRRWLSTKQQRWARQRNAFVANQTLRATPSGQVKPTSRNMLRLAPSVAALQWQARERRRPYAPANNGASPRFRGSGDPQAFCQSTRCRFAGSNGPKEMRQAVCGAPNYTPAALAKR